MKPNPSKSKQHKIKLECLFVRKTKSWPHVERAHPKLFAQPRAWSWYVPFIGVKDMEESKSKHQFGRQQNPQQYSKEGHSFVGTSKDGRPSTLLGRCHRFRSTDGGGCAHRFVSFLVCCRFGSCCGRRKQCKTNTQKLVFFSSKRRIIITTTGTLLRCLCFC